MSRPPVTESCAALSQAKALGFKVMLKPHVDLLRNEHPVGDYWRGDIGGCPAGSTPFTSSQWEAWFKSYSKFFLSYARLAEAEGVDMMSVNCELYVRTRLSHLHTYTYTYTYTTNGSCRALRVNKGLGLCARAGSGAVCEPVAMCSEVANGCPSAATPHVVAVVRPCCLHYTEGWGDN